AYFWICAEILRKFPQEWYEDYDGAKTDSRFGLFWTILGIGWICMLPCGVPIDAFTAAYCFPSMFSRLLHLVVRGYWVYIILSICNSTLASLTGSVASRLFYIGMAYVRNNITVIGLPYMLLLDVSYEFSLPPQIPN